MHWSVFISDPYLLPFVCTMDDDNLNAVCFPSPQAFATIEAIQCTEVYEFARSLDANNSPPLDTFQSYKLVYALRLTECGFPAEALR